MRSQPRTRGKRNNSSNRNNSQQTRRQTSSRSSPTIGIEMVKDNKWIWLNVGGTYFHTSRRTLIRATALTSPLHRISTSSTNVQFDRDDRGAYLIDRDPAYFSVVLNYLRHGHLLMTKDLTEEGVLIEAEYFGVPELSRIVKQRMSVRSMSHYLNNNQQFQDPFLTSLSATNINSNQSTNIASSGANSSPFNNFGLGPISGSLGGLLEV